jgi:Alginate lyase
MGTKYWLKITAVNSKISVYYNDQCKPKFTMPYAAGGNYFKIGAYTQSNPSKGDSPTDYSEVWVYSVNVTHKA